MDLASSLDAPCPPATLFAIVEDLGAYPEWLTIVTRATPAEPAPRPTATPAGPGPAADPAVDPVAARVADEAGDRPAWTIDLRGRLGPLARSKRLHMVRTVHEAPTRVRFERCELDGRSHSPWVLDAVVEPTELGSRLTMGLHYGGSFGGSVLERMLRDEIERSRPRLLDLVAAG